MSDREIRFYNLLGFFCYFGLTDRQVIIMLHRFFSDLQLREIAKLEEIKFQSCGRHIEMSLAKIRENGHLLEKFFPKEAR